MANKIFSTIRHKIFQMLKTIKPAFLRFPAVYILGLGVATAFSFCISTKYAAKQDVCTAWAFASGFMCVLSFCVQLAVEKIFRDKNRLHLIIQGLCIICTIPVFYLWKSFESVHSVFVWILVSAFAICPFLLSFTQSKEKIVLNIFESAFAALVLMTCVGTALSIIYQTIETLFLDEEYISNIHGYIWCFSTFVVFVDCFVAYLCRKEDKIKISKFNKVVYFYTLMPLFIIYLVVLYAYLVKVIVSFSIPMREANIFISIATALYILFCFTLPYYECKATRLFKKFVPFMLIPLIIMQIFISIDRICAHGISPERYAIVMYTLFSCLAIALSFIKKGAHIILLSPVLALLCWIAGVSPLSMTNVSLWSQTRIMEKVLNEHNLLVNGEVNTDAVVEALSLDEKQILGRSYKKIRWLSKKPSWLKENFEKTFGFSEYSDLKDVDYYFWVRANSDKKIDISNFSEIYPLECNTNNIVSFAGKTFDVRQELRKYLVLAPENYSDRVYIKEPVFIKTEDGFTIVLTALNAYAKTYEPMLHITDDTEINVYGVEGFAVK